MRLFVAVYLPPELQRKVWEAGDVVKGPWKREPVEKLHLTLKFIGEVSEERMKEIDAALKRIKHPPFRVTVRGVGAFPSVRNPRVVWVGAVGEGLFSLQKMVEDRLAELGVPREWRDFIPHVTLGRAKGKVDISSFLEKYESVNFGEFEVKEFTLVRSYLKPGGSEYEIIRRYPLED
jgi:2'-5' RNA ligase